MKIEGVTVCVGFDDFLAEAVPYNLPHLADWTICTTPEDQGTQAVCKKWGLRCLQTEVFRRDGSHFNKARGINHGLNHLKRDNWLLHIDADIVLPPRFGQFLDNAEMKTDCLYGCDRVNCPSWEEWQRYRLEKEWTIPHYFTLPPCNWPVGARLIHGDYGGWLPVGFFQLWHSSVRQRYPVVVDGSAEHSDVLHAAEWPRTRRVFLPDFYVVHLGTGPAGPPGNDWDGRKSPRFGPKLEAGKKSGYCL